MTGTQVPQARTVRTTGHFDGVDYVYVCPACGHEQSVWGMPWPLPMCGCDGPTEPLTFGDALTTPINYICQACLATVRDLYPRSE